MVNDRSAGVRSADRPSALDAAAGVKNMQRCRCLACAAIHMCRELFKIDRGEHDATKYTKTQWQSTFHEDRELYDLQTHDHN